MSLSSTADKILRVFLDSYPGSAQARGGRKLRRSNWASVFRNIASSVDQKELFLSAVDDLERRGIVSVRWKRHRQGDEVEAIYLENPDMMHRLLDLPTPRENAALCLRVLRAWPPRYEYGNAVRAWLLQRLNEQSCLPDGLADYVADLPKLLDLSPSAVGNRPLRALSGRIFSDTMRIEKILPDIDRISRSSLGESISGVLGLSRSYPQAGLRGYFKIVYGDGRTWKVNGETVYVDGEAVDGITAVTTPLDDQGQCARAIVIENKETFKTLPLGRHEFSLTLYGAGHPNTAVQKTLKLLSAARLDLYYFGDLDPEGLLIFQEFKDLCDGRLTPWMMNLQVFERHSPHGFPCTDGQLKRLGYLNPAILPNLAAAIRETCIGVEQEVIDLAGSDGAELNNR